MTDLANHQNSVTERDYLPNAEPGGVWYWNVMDPGAAYSPIEQMPMHGDRSRDAMLTATLDLEDMWASAVNKAVTKIAVKGYEISDNDDSTRRTEQGQRLIRDFDGPADYRAGLAKVVQDFLLCDNGWFVEVARASQKPGAKVQALYHLDSFRCWRTGNIDYPVLYLDYDGVWHKMRADQVIFGADMPSPRARMFGLGRCAASRAFQTIKTFSAVKTYLREKVTGSRALQLHFVMGVNKTQLQDAMMTAEAEQARKGHVVYRGAITVPMMPSDKGLSVATIDLASIPDGFDPEQIERSSARIYALAIGLNPDELIDRAAGLNSGQSAQVSENAAEESGGLPYFTKDFEDKLNFLVMPKPTIYQFKTNDIRDRQLKAVLDKTIADTIAVMRGNPGAPGWITDQMALQISVDENILPPEFLPQDATPAGQLTDSGDQSKPTPLTAPAPYAGQVPPPPNPMAASKAVGPDIFEAMKPFIAEQQKAVDELADTWKALGDDGDEWKEAVKWATDASES